MLRACRFSITPLVKQPLITEYSACVAQAQHSNTALHRHGADCSQSSEFTELTIVRLICSVEAGAVRPHHDRRKPSRDVHTALLPWPLRPCETDRLSRPHYAKHVIERYLGGSVQNIRLASFLEPSFDFLLRLHSRYGPPDRSAAQRRPLSRGSNPCGYSHKPLVS
jgi:hypothetical protein